jgi:hypothetical protein
MELRTAQMVAQAVAVRSSILQAVHLHLVKALQAVDKHLHQVQITVQVVVVEQALLVLLEMQP